MSIEGVNSSILGEQIAEGKTKVIYKIKDNAQQVLIVSKNSITAGNGLKKDEIPYKGKYSTITTANVYRLLTLSGIPTHYIQQESDESFRALNCKMIPLEVIVRRIAAGSYLKRFPNITQGTRFEPLVVEFTFKDDAKGDPLVTDDEIVAMQLQCGPVSVDHSVLSTLKSLASKSFAVLERGWKLMDVTLVDFKVEFGVTPDGKIILADVIDNDSWRIWPKGDPQYMKDKQVYRNLPIGQLSGTDSAMIAGNYAWVAEQTGRLLDALIEGTSCEGPLVGVIMGSQSDWDTMKNATDILTKLGVPFETRIVSAHRTPDRLFAYAKTAKARGLKVIIAGAGGAAHLPGMVAAMTVLPVLGVPVQSRALSGMDSLLSIVQMPGGVPVGTLAIGSAGATNAALLATSIVATSGKFPEISKSLEQYREKQTDSVAETPVDSPDTAPSHLPAYSAVTQITRSTTRTHHSHHLLTIQCLAT